jgi:hypothetical protein
VLRGCDVAAFTEAHAHTVGALLGATTSADAVDAHVVVVVASGASVLTGDAAELEPLAAAHSLPVRVLAI